MGLKGWRLLRFGAALALCVLCLQSVQIIGADLAVVDQLVEVQDLDDVTCGEVAEVLTSTERPPGARRQTATPALYHADFARARRWGS